MKKNILIIALFMSGLTVFGQTPAPNPANNMPKVGVDNPVYTNTVKDGKVVRSRGVNDIQEWFEFVAAYEEAVMLGNAFTAAERFPNYMYPDTSGYFVSRNATTQVVSKFPVRNHIVGHTFDPKDSNYLATQTTVLTKFNPYTVDSIVWVQSYVRNADSVNLGAGNVEIIDTLYLQYFDIRRLDATGYVDFGSTNGGRSYFAYPKIANYSPKTMFNSSALKTDTVLLGKAWGDSLYYDAGAAGWRISTRGIQVAPNFVSKSTNTSPIMNNVVGVSIVFKPMVKCTQGDTLVNFDDPSRSWTKKYNFYAAFHNQRTDLKQLNSSQYRLNNQFSSNGALRWGATTANGWKSYIPGNAYFDAYFFPMAFHITTSNLGVEDAKSNGFSAATVYPNPTAANSNVDVVFAVSKTSEVTVTITDMNGRAVKVFAPKTCAAGENAINLDVTGLSKGMYMVVLESAAGKTSTKLSIQ